MKNRVKSVSFEVINSSATSTKFIRNFNVFTNTKISLYYSVFMRTSGEKGRVLFEPEHVQSVSYSLTRSLSGLYTVVCLTEGKWSNCLGPPFLGLPSWYFACKYFSFLVINLLSAHIKFSEPHHNSGLCLQRVPNWQLQFVSRLGYSVFKGAPKNNCILQVLCLQRGLGMIFQNYFIYFREYIYFLVLAIYAQR